MWRILWTIFLMKITKKYSLKSKAMRKTPDFRFSVFRKNLRKANKCRTTITKKIPKFQKLKISLTRCENIQNITTLSLKKRINASADRNYIETLSFWEQNVVLRKNFYIPFFNLFDWLIWTKIYAEGVTLSFKKIGLNRTYLNKPKVKSLIVTSNWFIPC